MARVKLRHCVAILETLRQQPNASMRYPHEEKLVVWVLIDTGLRVSELANLKRANLDWQTHRLMIYGKGGPFGTKSKRRVIPLTVRIQPLIEGYFALDETGGIAARTIQRMLKRVVNLLRPSPVWFRPVRVRERSSQYPQTIHRGSS